MSWLFPAADSSHATRLVARAPPISACPPEVSPPGQCVWADQWIVVRARGLHTTTRSHCFGRLAGATAPPEPSAAIEETVPVVQSARVTGIEAEAPDTPARARATSAATPVRML